MRRCLAFLALAALLMVWLASARLAAEDDLARELPRIKPLEPETALRSFRVHAGFQLVPIAVEPQVTDPVSVCYDADGRLYVVEMRGYPYPEKAPTGNVRRLEDRDGDGRYETSVVFVDGLSWPTSVVPHDGGVFIACAPEILYAKDTDGDGVADIKKVMFTGFGTQNVQALVNGLLWGPDGLIYGVSGGNGGDIVNRSVPDAAPVSVRGRDFRFKPDGSFFEAISGGGQFGHAFDDWGHRFTCNNSNPIRQIVLPSKYLERNPALTGAPVLADIPAEGPAGPVFRISPAEPWRVVRTRQRAADPVMARRLPPTELVATGFFTSATGVTIYRGTTFAPEYRGHAFIGDVGGNLVHRKALTKHGVEYLATRADQGVEFLASTDTWFRPVNFANTPDGTLLILDMYRETIEHPISIPEPIKQHLDLTSGKDMGRLYDLVPDGFRPRKRPALSRAPAAVLVALLAHPDAWWRETAQRLLIERQDPAANLLLNSLVAARPNALGRLHALWTLDTLGAIGPESILSGLIDPEPGVRAEAARLTEGRVRTHPELLPPLLALVQDADAMVRFQAALALGEVADPKAIDALAALAVRDGGDRWVRTAILTAVPGRAPGLIAALAREPGYLANAEGRAWLVELAALIGAENQPDAIRAVLERFAAEGSDPAALEAVVLGLGRGLARSGGSLRSALAGASARRLASLFDRAATVAGSEGAEGPRANAIRLLGIGPIDRALDVVPPLLDAKHPNAIQLAALQTLAGLPDPRVGTAVVAHWKALGPSLRREAAEVLFARPERLNALLDAIEAKTVAPSDLEPSRRNQLLASTDAGLQERARTLLGTDNTRSDRRAAIEANRPALALTGDATKGRDIFRKTCATCHKLEGHGTDVGPNLATVAGRTSEDLLIHILDPNREVAPNALNYQVDTTDGLVLSGVIAEESAHAVTLKRAEGATDVVPRARIESIASTGLSLMPEGLEKGLAPRELADLIAYLRGVLPGR